MTNNIQTQKVKKPFCFAAFLFLLYPFFDAVCSFANSFIWDIQNNNTSLMSVFDWAFGYFFNYKNILGTALMYFEILLYIVIAVMLFIKHSGFGLTAVTILLLIASLFRLFSHLSTYIFNIFMYRSFRYITQFGVHVVETLSLALLVVMSILVALKKPRKGIMLLCFVPGAISVLYGIFYSIVRFVYCINYGMVHAIGLSVLFRAFAYLGLGIWLFRVSGRYKKAEKVEKKEEITA